MSNVIAFTREFISIDCGMVRTRTEDQNGIGPWSEPHFEHQVIWNEPDGTTVVWCGPTHEGAMRAAAEWGLPIVDRTGGRH